jgi:hypothetical protein
MDFAGPEDSDYENVHSLNRAYLSLLVSGPQIPTPVNDMLPGYLQRLKALSRQQTDRLATTPFLLFSLREQDGNYWEHLLQASSERDLFAGSPDSADEYGRLVAAALGFVWQLARQNPYTARLVCGASVHWCELIAEQTIFRLLALAGLRSDVLIPRFGGDSELWSKLLVAGVARENDVRQSAQISALQTMLTRPAKTPESAWALAACKRAAPRLRVADDPGDP